ncbi:hypothetical protein JTB14_030487 [Gonioctena quinquepunctata]|nr:hypothetical protein JTB14_030487 [Gonioctena quinquepunctata]
MSTMTDGALISPTRLKTSYDCGPSRPTPINFSAVSGDDSVFKVFGEVRTSCYSCFLVTMDFNPREYFKRSTQRYARTFPAKESYSALRKLHNSTQFTLPKGQYD